MLNMPTSEFSNNTSQPNVMSQKYDTVQQGLQPLSHSGPVSAWQYFADSPNS